ncbi:hypothetical protein MVEG_03167 [Podila verticillata NRRL 6337]|nr:hypothetical protein MVEG_03167 [Podila verticillata NRRL 6337]
MGHQPRAPSPLSQSFGPYQSTHIAPLNIVSRPCTSPKNPLSPITTTLPQSLLQDNVQNLWEMVDTALGHNVCSSASSSPTTRTSSRTNSMDSRNRSQLSILVTAEPESPSNSTSVDNDGSILIALSPRTFDLARTDLTKVHESIVSRLNNDTLLTLFPAPPQQLHPRCLIAKPSMAPVTSIAAAHIDATTTTTSTTTTMTTETIDPPCLDEDAQAKIRKQKLAAKRNWVIPPGLALVPSMESCNMSWAIDSFERSTSLESARDMPWASPYASQSCISLPEISMSMPLDSDTASLSDSFVSTSSAASLPSTRSLDNLDSLSHRLWAFEMQMRRASFLVDNRASVLSTIVPSSTVPSADQEQPAASNIPPLRLAIGKPSTAYHKDGSSSSSSETNSPVEADIEKGWLAWQEEWTHSVGRGRLPALSQASTLSDTPSEESDGDSSTVFSSIRSSQSSVVTAISHQSSTSLHKERFSKAGKPVNSNLFLTPKALNSKWHVASESALSSPRTTPTTPRSIKDNDPSLWETEHGQKWSDRFQFLVHNFQAAAGKHTRRLADIIPKSRSGRWGSKRMRSRHSEKEEEVKVK